MRARVPAAVAVLVLAATCLAGCRTNVGVAARVGGHTISESTVNDYLSPSVESVTPQGGTKTPAQTVVLANLIEDRLLTTVQQTKPLKPLASSTVEAVTKNALTYFKGRAGFISTLDLTGLPSKFVDLALNVIVRNAIVHQELGDTQGQANLHQLAAGLKIKPALLAVTVSPRYGKWDAGTLSLGAPVAPSYLQLQTASTADSGGLSG